VKPKIGTTVIYRSKTGKYSVPAIITATQDTLYQPAVDGGHIHPLSSPYHVHLTVLTPGIPGERLPDTDPAIRSQNEGGTYQEFNIPFFGNGLDYVKIDNARGRLAAPGEYSPQDPSTWTWVEGL
jgi:hypothetical protein